MQRAIVGSGLVVLAVAMIVLAARPVVARAAVNCTDFATQAAAQSYYESRGGPAVDPEGLDQDSDGIACETLPCPCRGLGTPPLPTPTPVPTPVPTPAPPPPLPDLDGDGVEDAFDQCPEVFARTEDGCPIPIPVYVSHLISAAPLPARSRVKPRQMLADLGAHGRVFALTWRGWGDNRATGRGIARLNLCDPACAAGKYKRYPGARVTLFRLRRGDCRGQAADFYTRARFDWPRSSRKRGWTAKLVAGCG
jgi:hypothetical protein